MSSDKKLLRIAPQRMGPKTAEGRARALAARIRGKLPHSVPIVPGVESQEEWEALRDQIVAEFEPKGTLEIELAHRIAELLWRLRRFGRYETDCAAWRMKIAEVPYHRLRDELRSEITGHKRPDALPRKPEDPMWLRKVRYFTTMALWYLDNEDAPDDSPHGEDAPDFIREAARFAGLDGVRVVDRLDWTVGDVRPYLEKIAKRAGMTAKQVVERLFAGAASEWLSRDKEKSAQQRQYEASLDAYKRTLVLPTEAEIRNAARWESHLERSLCRMMDRLERLQRMRAGEVVPAPAIVRVERDES